MEFARRDLKYRGFRDDRLASFEYKQQANVLLYTRVLTADVHEYDLLRQSWDTTNRPKYSNRTWSDEQQWALDTIQKVVSYEDELAKFNNARWLYIRGPPGSGKT